MTPCYIALEYMNILDNIYNIKIYELCKTHVSI